MFDGTVFDDASTPAPAARVHPEYPWGLAALLFALTMTFFLVGLSSPDVLALPIERF